MNKAFLVFLASALALCFSVCLAKPQPAVVSQDPKADFIFLEAANAISDERYDDYMMLLRRASALAPNDAFISGAIAEIQISDNTSDSVVLASAYKALKMRWQAEPANESYGTLFASVAKQAGNIDDAIMVWECLDTLLPGRTDPAMNLASALVAKGQTQADTASVNRALGIYTSLQKGLKGNVGLSGRKIHALAVKKDTAAIKQELKKLYAEAPRNIEASLFIGSVFNSLSMPDSTIKYLDNACAIDSVNGMVYLARASFFQMNGDSTAYAREVFRALESPELEFEPKFELLSDYVIKLYEDSTLRPKIDHMFETLLETNPGESLLHAFYGDYKASTGDESGAAEQYTFSLDLDPDNHAVWQHLTSIYGQLEQYPQMAETALAAHKRFKTEPYFPFMAASAKSQIGQQREALAILDSIDVNILEPHMVSTLHSTRGDILYAIEEADSAFAEYRKAIELDPENYMAMNNAAYFMSVAGTDLDTAELYASIATSAQPENSTFLDTQAWVYFKKKDYVRAREVMDKVLKLCKIIDDDSVLPSTSDKEPENEPSAEIYDHAGDIYFMTGDHRQALEFWKKALEEDPDNAYIRKKVEHKTYFFE